MMNFRVFIQFFLGVIGAFSCVVSCCSPSEATELPRPGFLDSHDALNACTYHLRDGVPHFLEKVEGKTAPVTVAYFGGSITAADGWRSQTLREFSQKWGANHFIEVNAAIGGTGSDLGVYRLARDVLAKNPDLVFIEFAVNDGGTPSLLILKQIEGIVRQIWKKNASIDIVFVYTYRVGHEKKYWEGELPSSVAAMEEVADFYGIPSIDFNPEVISLHEKGRLVYQSEEAEDGVICFSKDGVHPTVEGHRIYTELVANAFRTMEQNSASFDRKNRNLERVYTPGNYEDARLEEISDSMLVGNWSQLPEDSSLAWTKMWFGDRVVTSEEPGARMIVRFKGSDLGIYDVVGPNGGQVRVSIDGVEKDKPIPRFDRYCSYWRLATMRLASGLDPNSVHEAIIEIDQEEPDRSEVLSQLSSETQERDRLKYQGHHVWFGGIMVLGELLD